MTHRMTRRHVNAGIGAALISPAWASAPAFAQGGEPIKIGFSMAQTGSLAGAGKQALLGAQIWEKEINGKGGLLGRPRPVWDKPGGADASCCHAKGQDLNRLVRARCQS